MADKLQEKAYTVELFLFTAYSGAYILPWHQPISSKHIPEVYIVNILEIIGDMGLEII